MQNVETDNLQLKLLSDKWKETRVQPSGSLLTPYLDYPKIVSKSRKCHFRGFGFQFSRGSMSLDLTPSYTRLKTSLISEGNGLNVIVVDRLYV